MNGRGGLAIKEVAERTGLQPGTIRMWEQRYGFPVPARDHSGYRRYAPGDVETLRRVVDGRDRGLSVPAAIEAATSREVPTDRPSLYAAVKGAGVDAVPQRLTKRTLLRISRAIEDEAIGHAAAPVLVGAFQEEPFYRAVEHRYRRIARMADAAVVFADFDAVREPEGAPAEIPIAPADALGNEWAVVVDAPGYSACLLAWEDLDVLERGGDGDAERRFEAIWTLDPEVTRRASVIAGQLACRTAPAVGDRVLDALEGRPLALERPAPALTALTNRMVRYLEA